MIWAAAAAAALATKAGRRVRVRTVVSRPLAGPPRWKTRAAILLWRIVTRAAASILASGLRCIQDASEGPAPPPKSSDP